MKEIRPVPYEGNESYIFVSYAHRDMDAVYPIIHHMNGLRLRVWFDEAVTPGSHWDDNIANHVENCDVMVAFISANYIASDNCQDELNYAKDLGKDRLLIYLEDVKLPSGLAMRMNRLQAIHQYIYARQDDFFDKLLACSFVCRNRSTIPEENGKTIRKKKVSLADPERKEPERTSLLKTDITDPDELYKRGMKYLRGNGVKKNQEKALYYIMRAATLGHAKARFFIGVAYDQGDGVVCDYKEAVKWFQLAADQGYWRAQYNLGVHYMEGCGVKRDYAEALKWFRKVADKGKSVAQFSIGLMYELGQGVQQDYQEAIKWYQKAADQGEEKAKEALIRLKG